MREGIACEHIESRACCMCMSFALAVSHTHMKAWIIQEASSQAPCLYLRVCANAVHAPSACLIYTSDLPSTQRKPTIPILVLPAPAAAAQLYLPHEKPWAGALLELCARVAPRRDRVCLGERGLARRAQHLLAVCGRHQPGEVEPAVRCLVGVPCDGCRRGGVASFP